MIKKLIFFTPLAVLTFSEGLGWKNGHNISYYIILLWPLFLYVFFFLEHKVFILPKKITWLFIFFLIFSALSFFFAVNKETSVNYLFYNLAVFLIFIFVYNRKDNLEEDIILFTLIISLIFVFYSVLVNFFGNYFSHLIPQRGYQYVFPYYKTHNPLGSWLLIPLSILLFRLNIFQNRFYKFMLTIFTFFFIISYSRSSYFALVMTLIFYLIKNKNHLYKKLLITLCLLITGVFVIVQFSAQPIFRQINQQITSRLAKNISVDSKSFLGEREEYYIRAIKAINKRPFFGYGPGNFYYISKKYTTDTLSNVQTADNIFLEVISENGLLAGAVFLIIIILLLFNSKQSKLFYTIFALVVLFQIDSSQRYYSYLLIFFILAGLAYEEKSKLKVKVEPFLIVGIGLFFFSFNTFLSQLYLRLGFNKVAFYHQPFIRNIYPQLISDLFRSNKKNQVKKYLTIYYWLFPGDSTVLKEIAQYYQEVGDVYNAHLFYQKALESEPIKNLVLINNLFDIETVILGYNEAGQSFKKYLKNYYLKTGFNRHELSKDDVAKLCFGDKKILCEDVGINLPILFTEPVANVREESPLEAPYKAEYSINNDSLNERFNYSIKKPKGVFRIIVLGDSHAFGFLVNTKDNWTERLEDKLNYQLSSTNYKKYEVINLSYHGYDLAYQIERFRVRGLKYKPDLVIWLNNNFNRINEIFLPITHRLDEEFKANDGSEKYRKQGKYFSTWELAYEEYKNIIDEEKLDVEAEQLNDLNKFFDLYQGPVVFISFYDVPDKIEELLTKKTLFLKLEDFPENKTYFFEKIDSINPFGHQQLAETIFSFLQKQAIFNK